MKLEGIFNGEEYYPVRGTYKGIPYRIVQEGERFLLERLALVVGAGRLVCPVCFFFGNWQGVYTSKPLGAADCSAYVEDMAVCDDTGEPKGQCLNCGGKWHEHRLEVLPEDYRVPAAMIQAERICEPRFTAANKEEEK